MDDTKKIVVITDMRTEEAKEAAAYLADHGYDVRPVPETITLWHEDELRAFADEVREGLLGVIHPAPPAVLGGIEEITDDQWNAVANEGPVAALIVTKVFCDIFRDRQSGVMIYLNSIHAEKPVGKGYLYSMACAGIENLAKEAAQDYGAKGVNVYSVLRGISQADEDRKSDISPIYCAVDLRYPARRTPEAGFLNGLLAFLLTDAAYPLSGQPILADAGYTGYYNHRYRVEGRPYFERPKQPKEKDD